MKSVKKIFEEQNPQDGTCPEWAIILAETYANQQAVGCGVRWVKASERLPPTKGKYITKRPDLSKKQWIVSEENYNPKYSDISERWISFEHEWLDEQSPCNCERYRGALDQLCKEENREHMISIASEALTNK